MTRISCTRMLAAVFALAALPAASAAQNQQVLIIAGVGGDPAYTQKFHGWALTMADAAVKSGVPASNVVYLGETPTLAPQRIAGRSDSEGITAAFRDLASRSKPGDEILVVLIGHGSAEGQARFSIPGPDLTAADFSRLLAPLADRKVAIVNTASASGAFIEPLSAKNRVIVTATRSGNERNETVFAQYFVEAYAGAAADADKDGRTSLLEAFNYARIETKRFYDNQNRLMTEHAVLDDNGDGKAVAEPDGRVEGALARAFVLGGTAGAIAGNTDPAVRALYERRRSIEQQIENLRGMKERLPQAEYEKRLEDLLVSLAEVNQEIRKAEGGR